MRQLGWEAGDCLLGVVYRIGSVCRRFYCQNLKVGRTIREFVLESRPCTGICILHLGGESVFGSLGINLERQGFLVWMY